MKVELFHADRHVTKSIVVFRNFANAPINLHTAHRVHLCVVYASQEKSAPLFLHNIDLLDFRTQTACVYSAVRAESLKIIDVSLSL